MKLKEGVYYRLDNYKLTATDLIGDDFDNYGMIDDSKKADIDKLYLYKEPNNLIVIWAHTDSNWGYIGLTPAEMRWFVALFSDLCNQCKSRIAAELI